MLILLPIANFKVDMDSILAVKMIEMIILLHNVDDINVHTKTNLPINFGKGGAFICQIRITYFC
jgi:hypothetical protein